MKESASPVNQKNRKKGEGKKKLGIGVLSVLLLLSIWGAYQAFTHEEEIQDTSSINVVEQRVSMDYFAVVNPSILYPEGGRITPDEAIFTQLTDSLIIDLKMEMDSEEPVGLDAFSQVLLRIVAKDIWQRDAVLIAKTPIDTNESDQTVLDQEIEISLSEILSFIDSVEKETLVRAGEYQIQIIPRIEGDILNDQREVIASADNEVIIPFEITPQYVSYAVEDKTKEFSNTVEIVGGEVSGQNFKVFGMDMSPTLAKILFPALALISLAGLIGLIKGRSDAANKNEDRLIHKYSPQMAAISSDTVFDEKSRIILKDFSALIKISEDKDEPILKRDDATSNTASYHVVGPNYIYTYKPTSDIEAYDKNIADAESGMESKYK